MSLGIMSGAFCLYLVDRKVSGVTPDYLVGNAQQPVIPARIWIFVIAIIAHNIPEGMAIGVSAGGGMHEADSLAMGIALQDVPEGLVIALVLAGAGMARYKAFLIGAASGLVEPVFAVLCAWMVRMGELLLPLGLAFAAGAMLLVVTHEIIPESRSNGHHKLASLGLCVGFCLMMVMDTALS
jgi:ZIP family zinc transporter